MNVIAPPASYGGLLGTYLRPQRARVGVLAGLLFAGIALQLLNPQVIRFFIDTTQAQGALDALVFAAAAFIAIGLAQQGVTLATAYLGLRVGWTATNALRGDLARHLLRLDMPFHKTHTPGELIERVDGDVTTLASFFSRFVLRLIGNGLLIIAVLALLFREDWRAGAGLTVYVLGTLLALAAIQNFGARRWAAARQADSELYGFLEERLGGLEDIRGVGAEGHVLRQLYDRMRAMLQHSRRAEMAGSLNFVISNFLYLVGYGLGLGLGAYLYTSGAVTIGTAFIIVYYITMLAAPLENIREEAQNLQQARAGIARVRALLALQPSVVEAKPGVMLPPGPLAVTFDRVSFAYDDGAPGTAAVDGGDDRVLRDVSFAVQPGRVLGVLGRTGSGKTTLTRLLFRLYDPTAGTIRLGDVDVRAVAFADLRARVGMVTQDVQLFQASVRDNIAFFNGRVADKAIGRAVAELGLTDWVAAMPAGLDTPLGAGGGMSAGEAQLLAFTRVFLRDPGLVILDEAASRLDPVTEHRLEQAIDRLLTGRTAIIIAHRLRTVGRADDILILDGGRVVEYGPRATLAADPAARFYALLQTGLEEALA
ncbi:MAG TPA: ABC transporter ATP-binding protein [Chloroflexia bacterium]|nr:ABC transporter ATP-binding protein [Chloroflexia bacterium]